MSRSRKGNFERRGERERSARAACSAFLQVYLDPFLRLELRPQLAHLAVSSRIVREEELLGPRSTPAATRAALVPTWSSAYFSTHSRNTGSYKGSDVELPKRRRVETSASAESVERRRS